MKHQKFYTLFAAVLLMALVLTACQPATTPTEAPAAPTTAPEPTKAPEQPAATEATIAYEGMKVEAPNCDYGGEFKSIEAVDEFTVKFTLCNPDPAFPSKVAFSVFSIADKDDLDANGGDSIKMTAAPNGTGPYVLKDYKPGDSIILEANPDYYGEKAAIKDVIFRWSEQSAQRLLELQSGTVDGIDNPAPEDFATIEADTNLKLYPRPPLNIFYVGFNNTMAPFDNVKVRQAFAMALDRQRIVDNYYPEGSQVADAFVPSLLKPGYTDGLKWYDYDAAAAKALLAEAGYKEGDLKVTLSYRNVVRGYLPSPDKVAQEIQAELKEIGVTVEIEQMESAAFIDATSAGQKPFYLLGWGADYPDSTNFYDYHFANENNKQFGNLFPDLAAEIKAAAQVADATVRQQHYDKANELIKEYVPMIPVAHGASATAFKASVVGAHASPLSNEVFAAMSGSDQLVWLQNGEPAALWCSDETDGETLRACEQIYQALMSYKVGDVAVEPGLAESFDVNPDATEYVFHLRQGVKFHNGAALDANDVVATFVSQWDASSPNHKGRTTTFEYFGAFFGSFLNAE